MIFIFVCEANSKYFEIRQKNIRCVTITKGIISRTTNCIFFFFFFFQTIFSHKAQNKRNLTDAFQSSVLGIGQEPSELGKMAHI